MFSWRIKREYQLKKTRSADFCADKVDVITNFAVITNVVIKRVHYMRPERNLNYFKSVWVAQMMVARLKVFRQINHRKINSL